MDSVPFTAKPVVREHFIPLRAEDVARLLTECAPDEERAAFVSLCELLRSVFHFEYHEQLNRLKSAYAPFDPDCDTVPLNWGADSLACPQSVKRFFDELIPMFEKANFRRLDGKELRDAIEERSDVGLNLHVDFSVFERLEVFVRGETTTQHTRRRWQNFFREETISVDVHQRLVVAFRLHSDVIAEGNAPGSVTLKIFKDIPRGDIEMLLPGTRVQMTLLDRLKIALPTVSGLVVTIVKIVKGAFVMAMTGVYGALTFLGMVGGTIGYGIKSFFGYLRTRDRYQANLTRNLYYQNLDNNAGVLFRLVDEVEEQEFREAMLAYAVLLWHAPSAGLSLNRLDQVVEELLQLATQRDIDFEARDAVDKLERLGMIYRAPHNRYRAIPISTALCKLDAAWDSYFEWNTATVKKAA